MPELLYEVRRKGSRTHEHHQRYEGLPDLIVEKGETLSQK